MPTLPSGTVTLLFTDIEGSTRLLRELGEAYEQLLTEHRGLLRTCVEDHGGVIVDTQGDAFFVAFAAAHDALAAAVETQRAHAAHDWPASAGLRVRMAIHTGEPTQVGEGLVGLAVHRAARICAAGHGGQILLSSTTRDIVQDHLPPGVALIDLGHHRLKDLDRPEGIVQVVAERMPPVLAPLKTLDAQPARATPFAGQETRLAEAAEAAVAGKHEGTQTAQPWLGTLTKAVALDWRRFVPAGHARLANRLAGLGLSIHATARIATREDLQRELRHLGRAFVAAARDARDADSLLRREDRGALDRRLAEYRRYAQWDAQFRAADSVAVEIAALDTLARARREFEDEARKVEAKVRSVRARVFEARLDSAKIDDLLHELEPLREAVELLGARLGAAYREGVRAAETATPVTSPRHS
jgi:class 3 adenylate cyclase